LSDDERAQLEAWARRRSSAQALALRLRIVLAASEGPNNTEIAAQLQIAVSSVRKWRNRFAEHRLDGLSDEPRPGRPRTISDEQVDEPRAATRTKAGRRCSARRAAWPPEPFCALGGQALPGKRCIARGSRANLFEVPAIAEHPVLSGHPD